MCEAPAGQSPDIVYDTRLLPADADGIQAAAQLLRAGAAVGIPTETVYGLAANALDAAAVAGIFAAKGRPQDNPLIVHIADMQQLQQVAAAVPSSALALAAAFWPGPLTMVLPRGAAIPAAVSAGLDTVAVRMPAHPAALDILRAAGLPLAAPSGNRSGRPSPTTAAHMLEDMTGRIPLIVDGGPCSVGVESTVLSLCGDTPLLLRPGAVTPADIEAVLGVPVQVAAAVTQALQKDERPVSPGMKYRHYAPQAALTLVKGDAAAYAAYVNAAAGPGVMALCFDEDVAHLRLPYISYGPAQDAAQQAQKLFWALHRLDALKAETVFVHCPDTAGVALAVYNRLLRAAAFRVVEAQRSCAPKPLVVGLTGRSGCGKSTVAALWRAAGCVVLDADVISAGVYTQVPACLDQLRAVFGDDIVDENGDLRRRLLGQRAFATPEGQKQLTAITHPHIIRLLLDTIEQQAAAGAQLVVVDGAVIVGEPFEVYCQKIVVVDAPDEVLTARLCARDGISAEAARQRLAVQLPRQRLLAAADHVITNTGTQAALAAQAQEVLRRLEAEI